MRGINLFKKGDYVRVRKDIKEGVVYDKRTCINSDMKKMANGIYVIGGINESNYYRLRTVDSSRTSCWSWTDSMLQIVPYKEAIKSKCHGAIYDYEKDSFYNTILTSEEEDCMEEDCDEDE